MDQSSNKGHVTHDIHHQFVEDHHQASSTKIIWRVFWLLLIVTLIEVGIAFTAIPRTILIYIFVALTIVKAYYIVAYFMHLKHERIPFRWSILLPFVLIIYLIFICLYEGVGFFHLDK